MNKQAAEYWWGKAAVQGHAAAVQNLQMLHTNPEEGVSFFGARSKGKRFVFVIDKSGSMNSQGRLGKAKRELIATLQSLKPDTRFMVYFFDHIADPMPVKAMMAATWVPRLTILAVTEADRNEYPRRPTSTISKKDPVPGPSSPS